MQEKLIKNLENKKIAILGFGIEGKSTYRFIRKYSSMPLTILDKNNCSFDDLIKDDPNVEVIFENYLDNLDDFDVIIKAPGVILNNIDISKFKHKITSQLELLLENFHNNIIGVTGTKGKSTTTSLIYEIFKNQNYDAYLVGNIGVPIFDEIEHYKDTSILIIEMSALQLEFVKNSPHIGIILNLYEDHLDHAGTLEHYHENKLNIIKFQKKNDIAIYASDNKYLQKYIDNSLEQELISVSLNLNSTVHIKDNYVYYKNKKLYDINSKRNLKGNCNLENIMFCLAVAEIYYLDLTKTIDTINNFKPLEHRIELVGTFDGITYYNDSIATIPEATINALETLKNVDTLIFGGLDRGINYNDFVSYLKLSTVSNLICMPTTGYNIGNKLMTSNKKIYMCETLEEAVKTAKKVTKKDHICLMSPAAASYEYFNNYIEKENKFKELVSK